MRETNRKALEWCISKSVPFCIFRRPGEKDETFYSAPSLLAGVSAGNAGEGFFISEFNKPFSEALWIPFEMDAVQTLQHRMEFPENPYRPVPVEKQDTDETEYKEKLSELISRLGGNNAVSKVVVSVVKYEYFPFIDLSEAVSNILENSKGCFCHCYYHPLTGFWIGASPELLLDYNAVTGRFSTMALAGTCRGNTCSWNNKDVQEQEVVKSVIGEKLGALGIDYRESRTKTKGYNGLSHRLTDFTGVLGRVSPVDVIDSLNPTPALAGYPLHDALREISAIESHARRCYGGYVGVSSDKGISAFVNIRCANVLKSEYCFYSGGGILKTSDASAEWNEACLKREAFVNLMLN